MVSRADSFNIRFWRFIIFRFRFRHHRTKAGVGFEDAFHGGAVET